jgi:hypothetical protein
MDMIFSLEQGRWQAHSKKIKDVLSEESFSANSRGGNVFIE